MAAAVLIAILVLTLIVYLSANFSAIKADNVERMNQQSLEAFNGKYLTYDGRTDLTYYDILNITTMARKDNENEGSSISVYIGTKELTLDVNYKEMQNKFRTADTIDDSGNEKSKEIMEIKPTGDIAIGGEKDTKVLVNYSCNIKIGESTGMVEKVTFKKYTSNNS